MIQAVIQAVIQAITAFVFKFRFIKYSISNAMVSAAATEHGTISMLNDRCFKTCCHAGRQLGNLFCTNCGCTVPTALIPNQIGGLHAKKSKSEEM